MKFWLLTNTASGSYSADAVDALCDTIRSAGFELDRTVCFPDDELPSRADLERAGVSLFAVFTGDGTVNSAVTSLYGWGGAVLVLPGGTMNLLSKRLHGEADSAEIIERIASGGWRAERPPVIRSRHGDALVGFMGGPATTWYKVREAMREVDIGKIVDEATEAVRDTSNDPQTRVADPSVGSAEGYPLVEVVPGDVALKVIAYNPQTLGDYIKQGFVTILRKFREGPHEVLGEFDRLVLEDVAGEPLRLSIDGEPQDGDAREELVLARTEVDLLATA